MHAGHDQVLENLARIREGIARGAELGGRDPDDVLVVAAAKKVPVEPIRWVLDAGVSAIGENYVNELRDMHGRIDGARWHFIGALQTNTVHHVAAFADVVETATDGRATQRLARRVAEEGRTLDVLMEVDFTGERTGAVPADAPQIAARLEAMEGLRLRGLMTLPPLGVDAESARPWFRTLRALRDRVREDLPEVLELSMGMSLDYEVAAEEGATMVRIGTALFGPRTP
jgi:pyridoxal phosphate enzyme (YggS family)